MSAPTVGSLFAGYEGIGLALKDVFDADLAWVSEIDAAPSKILAHHWPDVPNLGDITQVDWSQVEPVDIITGGSPCQDVSSAGKRAGMRAGTRSGLWASMCDAIDIIRPSLVIWENVRGALSATAASASDLVDGPGPMGDRDGGHLRALGRVLGDLADIGYDAAWVGLRAADVGAPHGRFRIFVLAWPQGDATALTWPQGDATALLPTPVVNDMGASYDPEGWDEWTARLKASHGNGNGHGVSLSIETLRMLPTPTVSDANGPGAHGDGGVDLRTAVSLLPTPRATDGTKGGPNQRGSSGDLMLPSAVTHLLPTPNASLVGPHGERGARTLESRAGRQIELPDVIAGVDFGVYAPAIARWEAITRPAPPPTEPTGRHGAHRLSPRFVEWMQGLPDGHVTGVPGISRNDQLKALGNGVVPQQCAEAVRWLLGVRASLPGQVAA